MPCGGPAPKEVGVIRPCNGLKRGGAAGWEAPLPTGLREGRPAKVTVTARRRMLRPALRVPDPIRVRSVMEKLEHNIDAGRLPQAWVFRGRVRRRQSLACG